VKTHYNDPLWNTFRSSIIIHIVKLFQKYSTFNFRYQIWFLGLKNHYFYKLNVILYYLFKKFTTYIERSMNIFRIYISIIGPLTHFDCTNFKVSLVIKNLISMKFLKGPYSYMLVIFHANAITCQYFNLKHIYHIFAKKTHFLK
jgi:hypothetical protein